MAKERVDVLAYKQGLFETREQAKRGVMAGLVVAVLNGERFDKPGEKIPVDAKVIKGTTTVDESMLTGESMPIDKTVDNEVIGATLNKNGVITIQATKVGQDTALSNIIKVVEEAQSSKVTSKKKQK